MPSRCMPRGVVIRAVLISSTLMRYRCCLPKELNLMAGSVANQAPRLSLAGALASFKSAFVGTALMSGMINVLALTGSFFMLQVYDRVIPSRSVPTLIGLCLVAGVLYIFQGFLEVFRSRVLSRIALAMD